MRAACQASSVWLVKGHVEMAIMHTKKSTVTGAAFRANMSRTITVLRRSLAFAIVYWVKISLTVALIASVDHIYVLKNCEIKGGGYHSALGNRRFAVPQKILQRIERMLYYC